MVCINIPLIFNFHKAKEEMLNSNYEKLTIIYDEKDQSINYISLIKKYKS